MQETYRKVGLLLQKKADLLDEKKRILSALSTIEPIIEKAQKELLQSTCNHPRYEEISYNTDNKYSGRGMYKCILCGHTKQESW